MQAFLAYAFVGSLYALAALAVVISFYRSPYTVPQSMLYFVDVMLTRILWRAHVPRQLPIPIGHGAVLIANHRSSVDPCFVQLPAQRPVHWMVANDFVSHPLIGRYLKFVEAIPTRRSGIDVTSTKTAIRLARNGGVIGMFPEGRINRTEDFMLDVRPGAAMIALNAGVPLIPCYIEGSPYDGTPAGALLMPARVKLKLGKPIYLDSYAGRENDRDAQAEVTLQGVRAIADLAGRPDFEPRLAGKKWHKQIGDSQPLRRSG